MLSGRSHGALGSSRPALRLAPVPACTHRLSCGSPDLMSDLDAHTVIGVGASFALILLRFIAWRSWRLRIQR